MKMLHKTIILIVFTTCILVIISLFASWKIISNGFIKSAKHTAQESTKLIANAIEHEAQELDKRIIEWAYKDETYNFITSKSNDYVRNNFLTEKFKSLNIDDVIVFDNNGDLILSLERENKNNLTNFTSNSENTKFIRDNLKSIFTSNNNAYAYGLFTDASNKAVMIASRKILPMNLKGKTRGTLVFIRYFDNKLVEEMRELTGLDFEIYPTISSNLPKDVIAAKKNINDINKYYIQNIDSSSFDSYTYLYDLNYNNSTILKTRYPSLAKEQIRITSSLIAISISLAGLLLSFLAYLFLKYKIFNKLSLLTNEVDTFVTQQNISLRVTEYKGVDEVAKLTRAINNMLSQIENTTKQIIHSSKLSTLGTLAASIVHEINNPLTVIKGHVYFIKNTISESNITHTSINDSIVKIEKTLDKIAHITNGIRTFSRIDADFFDKISVHALIKESIELIDYILEKDKVEIHFDFQAVNDNILGSEGKFQQVFINLLSNAKDALSEQRTKKVTITTKNTNSHIEIRVMDNGPGIPIDKVSQIFEAFYTTKPAGKGTGLGLSISSSIVIQMNGTICVEHTSSSGTIFLIKIPNLS